jgi:hypothetical protein
MPAGLVKKKAFVAGRTEGPLFLVRRFDRQTNSGPALQMPVARDDNTPAP